ncbi:MAG TPA: amidohydrolase [Sumerlaeia bacterium]|nr:amidohydrolase [Sumerlaeia bacterium]
MATLALTNAEIETITKGRIAKGTILVRDGKIASVGKSVRIPKNAEVVDVKGRLVTPGLIEAHSHAGLAEDGFPSDADYNEMTDPVTPHLMAIDGFKPTDVAMLEAAESGVTTMFLTQGSANVFCGIGAIVKTWGTSFYDQVVNPAAGMKLATGENPKRVYGEKGKTPATRMAIAAIFRKTFTEARTYMEKKKVHARKRSKSKDPFEVDLRLEAVARLLRGEFPARCHSHRSIDMLAFMRIAEEFKFRYCFEHATEAIDILDELKKRRVPVVIGPTMGGRSKVELHHRTFETVVRAVEAGLTVAVTSDHHVTPMKNLPVYAALAVRQGLPEKEALKTMTINPAKILEIETRLGSIEPGKEADLVVWSGDPLDVRSKPERVYIKGRLVDVKASRRALFERD